MKNIADSAEIILQLGLSGAITEEQRAIVTESRRFAEGQVRRYLKYDPANATRTEYYPNIDFTQQRRGIYEVTDTKAYLRYSQEASTDELQIRHIPLRSITSLNVDYDGRAGSLDTSFAAETAWTEGTDFWPNYDSEDSASVKVCSDGIIRSEGRWPSRAGSVKIVYVAGYTAAEFRGAVTGLDASPILDAVIDESTRKFNQIWNLVRKKTGSGFSGPLTSERLGDYSYTIDGNQRSELYSGGGLSDQSRDRLFDFVRFDFGIV